MTKIIKHYLNYGDNFRKEILMIRYSHSHKNLCDTSQRAKKNLHCSLGQVEPPSLNLQLVPIKSYSSRIYGNAMHVGNLRVVTLPISSLRHKNCRAWAQFSSYKNQCLHHPWFRVSHHMYKPTRQGYQYNTEMLLKKSL